MKDWNWLLNSMVYGHLFPNASEEELGSLRKLGLRWKVCLLPAAFEVTRAETVSCRSGLRQKGNLGL